MSAHKHELTPSANGENGDGRDAATGRFAPGWKGGPGRPPSAARLAFAQAFRDSFTAEEVQALARKLYQMALDGDVSAARELLARLLGAGSQQQILDLIDAPPLVINLVAAKPPGDDT